MIVWAFPQISPSPGGGALPIFKAHLFVARQSGGQLQEPDGAGRPRRRIFFSRFVGGFSRFFVVVFFLGWPGEKVVVSSYFFFWGWGQFLELFFLAKINEEMIC